MQNINPRLGINLGALKKRRGGGGVKFRGYSHSHHHLGDYKSSINMLKQKIHKLEKELKEMKSAKKEPIE